MGGFRLAFRQRLDRAAPDLAQEGTGIQREGNCHGELGRQLHAEQPQAEIHHEELHQQRPAGGTTSPE